MSYYLVDPPSEPAPECPQCGYAIDGRHLDAACVCPPCEDCGEHPMDCGCEPPDDQDGPGPDDCECGVTMERDPDAYYGYREVRHECASCASARRERSEP